VAAKKPNVLIIWGDDIGWAIVGMFMKSMMKFPPRQSPESWSPGKVMEKLRQHREIGCGRPFTSLRH